MLLITVSIDDDRHPEFERYQEFLSVLDPSDIPDCEEFQDVEIEVGWEEFKEFHGC